MMRVDCTSRAHGRVVWGQVQNCRINGRTLRKGINIMGELLKILHSQSHCSKIGLKVLHPLSKSP